MRYVPGGSDTVKRPLASDRKSATCRAACVTLNPALKGASQTMSARHTGVTGPRLTTPVSPVISVGASGRSHADRSSAAATTSAPNVLFIGLRSRLAEQRQVRPRILVANRPVLDRLDMREAH